MAGKHLKYTETTSKYRTSTLSQKNLEYTRKLVTFYYFPGFVGFQYSEFDLSGRMFLWQSAMKQMKR